MNTLQNLSSLPMCAKKLTASLLHLFFLVITLFGIGTMYMNDNLGVGIVRISDTAYEETTGFNEQFNRDMTNIFRYIKYRDTFGSDDSVSLKKRMLSMMFGPSDTENYTLEDLIHQLESSGYKLNEDFSYVKTSTVPGIDPHDKSGYILWTAINPDETSTGASDSRRGTLNETALSIMDTLHVYYTTYHRLIASPSNLHFRIVYSDPASHETETYENDASLTEENVKQYGKYAILPGNSVFFDTNIPDIPLNTIPSLAAVNPYSGSNFYMIAAVDTTYPVRDIYSEQSSDYRAMQKYYIGGFVLMILGSLVSLVTLIYLIMVSGHHDGTNEIFLHRIDQTKTETGLLISCVIAALAYAVCRIVVCRIAHLTLPEESWYMADRSILMAAGYLCLLFTFFSLLRRYKARVIWTNSFLRIWHDRMAMAAVHQPFRVRLTASFLFYLMINAAMILLFWFIRERILLPRSITHALLFTVFAAIAVFNLWVLGILMRRYSELDRIADAVDRLAAGDSTYKIDTSTFDGRELLLAEGINNIGDGMETAVREKVKSERLKADLITNVSHDIKTPLTSIINYVDLIKRENITDPRILGYLEILTQKSQRLKTLTEDLVEASKASSGNIRMDMVELDLVELVMQASGEFEDRFDQRHLTLVMNAPDERMMIRADGRSLWRVIENLFTNVCKYALDSSRVYVDLTRRHADLATLQAAAEAATEQGSPVSVPDRAVFTIKNISSSQLNIHPDELTERFVRGDVSRTTEGSGLGLSIAKSLTELMHGDFRIVIDGDLFKAEVTFDILP